MLSVNSMYRHGVILLGQHWFGDGLLHDDITRTHAEYWPIQPLEINCTERCIEIHWFPLKKIVFEDGVCKMAVRLSRSRCGTTEVDGCQCVILVHSMFYQSTLYYICVFYHMMFEIYIHVCFVIWCLNGNVLVILCMNVITWVILYVYTCICTESTWAWLNKTVETLCS